METILKLQIDKKGENSYLKDCSFTSPLKIGQPKSFDDRLQLVLMMASAGVLKGDTFAYQIVCENGTKAVLTEQSYTKLFDMGEDGMATKEVSITVGHGASLFYKPCATIPFKNSCFYGKLKINLEKDAEFLYRDIFAIGRVGMGERFLFRRYENAAQISMDGKLVFIEHCLYEPAQNNLQNMLYLGDYTHQGTLYYYGQKEVQDRILQEYRPQREAAFVGITQAVEGICVRVLARSAQEIEEIMDEIEEHLHL